MSDELFPPEAVAALSPRLEWIARRKVRTHYAIHCEDSPWCAWFPDNEVEIEGMPNDPEACGYGDTEDEAITSLCKRYRVPLWNEEPELRDRWLRDHCVRYSKRPNCFTAWTASAPMQCFTALELDDALAQLAAKNGWKTWNQ